MECGEAGRAQGSKILRPSETRKRAARGFPRVGGWGAGAGKKDEARNLLIINEMESREPRIKIL